MDIHMNAAYIQEVHQYMEDLLTDGIYAEYMGMGTNPNGTLYPMYRYTDRGEGLLVVDQADGKVYLKDLITGESGIFDRDAWQSAYDKRGFFHANF